MFLAGAKRRAAAYNSGRRLAAAVDRKTQSRSAKDQRVGGGFGNSGKVGAKGAKLLPTAVTSRINRIQTRIGITLKIGVSAVENIIGNSRADERDSSEVELIESSAEQIVAVLSGRN